MAEVAGVARIVGLVRRAARAVALVGGVLLLASVAMVVVEIGLRKLAGTSLGGVDELSGYMLALVATWSFAYALAEQAHVRIDLISARLAATPRAVLDTLALATTAAVAVAIAILAWPVLERSLAQGSHANTPMQTPLWIPQSLWVAGWAWFALVACVLTACAAVALASGSISQVDGFAGIRTGEGDGEPAPQAVEPRAGPS
ncbi:MAG: TRAP transporter small permease [Rhodospirillaceae bacterium]|nr:TRAP transporter small permease [Rhodospirillaceae bacterium]